MGIDDHARDILIELIRAGKQEGHTATDIADSAYRLANAMRNEGIRRRKVDKELDELAELPDDVKQAIQGIEPKDPLSLARVQVNAILICEVCGERMKHGSDSFDYNFSEGSLVMTSSYRCLNPKHIEASKKT